MISTATAAEPAYATTQPIDNYAATLPGEIRSTVYNGTKITTEKRVSVLAADYPDPDALRKTAGQIKQHTIENLDTYLEQAEKSLVARGATVHYALDGDEANRIVLDLLRQNQVTSLVKAKSMVSEETELAPFLSENGVECIETDLGEFIIQIDGDHPSHIIRPIIHKNRRQIAESFEREGLGAYDDDPQTITSRARSHLRHKYLTAQAGLTGANFICADTGQLVLVTNEGNSRFCLAAPKIHIALVGIEKIIPKQRDLALFLNLIGRSGTGQQLTVYTEFIAGPKSPQQPDGPEQMHVIFLDNRRTDVLATQCRDILRCIRCGACLNVCPVYRQASGHAYRSVYPGPVGAVLSPLLAGDKFPLLADLPKASSLCGACNEVCPVDIPIPDLLLRLRDKAKREGSPLAASGTPPMTPWAMLATMPTAWKTSLFLSRTMNKVPIELIPLPPAQAWTGPRKLPPFRGGKFRDWLKTHKKAQAKEKKQIGQD